MSFLISPMFSISQWSNEEFTCYFFNFGCPNQYINSPFELAFIFGILRFYLVLLPALIFWAYAHFCNLNRTSRDLFGLQNGLYGIASSQLFLVGVSALYDRLYIIRFCIHANILLIAAVLKDRSEIEQFRISTSFNVFSAAIAIVFPFAINEFDAQRPQPLSYSIPFTFMTIGSLYLSITSFARIYYAIRADKLYIIDRKSKERIGYLVEWGQKRVDFNFEKKSCL